MVVHVLDHHRHFSFCICTLLQRTASTLRDIIPLYTAPQKGALSPSFTKQRTRNHRPVAFCCTPEQRTNIILDACLREPPDEANDKGQDERQKESDKDDRVLHKEYDDITPYSMSQGLCDSFQDILLFPFIKDEGIQGWADHDGVRIRRTMMVDQIAHRYMVPGQGQLCIVISIMTIRFVAKPTGRIS